MQTLLNKLTFGKLGSITGVNTAAANVKLISLDDNLAKLKQELRLKHGARAHTKGKTATVVPVHHRAVTKGVTAKVIGDDVVAEQKAPVAEVIIPINAATDEDEPADLRFWNAFIQRIAPEKGECMTFKTHAEVLDIKATLSKGYHVFRLAEVSGDCSPLAFKHNNTGIGVIHITKNNISAIVLVDSKKGTFRTISGNNRFHGQAHINVVEAKAFLNGR